MPADQINQALKIIQENPSEFVVILGPTCTGKTALSLVLANHFQVPIINADSRLIFQEMDIGTAKPTLDELNIIKHFLINIKKPNETYSAGEFQQDFDKIASDLISNQSHTLKAIIVGGTGLYIKSALDNLNIPRISPNSSFREELGALDLESLQKLLNELDASAKNLIDMKNKIRIIRAIEIIKVSGKKLSDNRKLNPSERYKATYIGLNYSDREFLYSLINKRVVQMIEAGLVDETQQLIDIYGATQTLKSTIGYREIISYLNQEINLEESIYLIQKNTRNYAKRQITWFKSNPKTNWIYK
ncbi:MAG: miaA [Cyanobacteriota bacterium]|jgi:tRNA dimethylallyltransferase